MQGLLHVLDPAPALIQEKRVLQKLDAKLVQIVEGALARIPAAKPDKPQANSLEAYTFEHFDLNGDGIITREEFNEARRRILTGQGLKAPSKTDTVPPAREKVPRGIMIHLYSQAARRLQEMKKEHSDADLQASRLVIEHCVKKGLQQALLMGASAPDALAEAQADIAAIRASKKRVDDATKKAEERLDAASTKVQAVARGRQVRQKKDLLEKSAVTLQRALRRLRQQWHQSKKFDFAAVVRAVKGQRREWAMEYQRVASDAGLDKPAFVEALGRACTDRVSSLQAGKF